MKTYGFDVVLKDVTAISDEQADALFATGCDDGTPVPPTTWPGFISIAKLLPWKKQYAQRSARFMLPA